MRENVKLDVAIEILSSKIADAINQKNKEETERLLLLRKRLYSGEKDVIEQLINSKKET